VIHSPPTGLERRGIALDPPRSVQDVTDGSSTAFDAAAGDAVVLINSDAKLNCGAGRLGA
jgi:hypothetical protein